MIQYLVDIEEIPSLWAIFDKNRSRWPQTEESRGQIVEVFRGKAGRSCYLMAHDTVEDTVRFIRVTGLTRYQRACWGA